MRNVWMVMALVACSKSSPEATKETKATKAETGSAVAGSAAAGSGSAASEPAEAAAVSGPTKSATGSLDVSGAVTGSFSWIKKDQRAPITCMWNPESELGTLKIDLSDGAGHVLTVGIDIPPSDVGPGHLEISSKDLPGTLKTYSGFALKGDDPESFTVNFDNATAVTDPDAQMKTGKKKTAEPPPDPHVTLEGTLEVSCPKKK